MPAPHTDDCTCPPCQRVRRGLPRSTRRHGVLTDWEVKLALTLASKRPFAGDPAGPFWHDIVRSVADSLYRRPDYHFPLTVAMHKWQEFTDTAGYLDNPVDPLADWTEAEKREAWGR